jgi:hypothetical protein
MRLQAAITGCPALMAYPEWLAGSPFSDYVVPSLVLFVVVGGALALAGLLKLLLISLLPSTVSTGRKVQ